MKKKMAVLIAAAFITAMVVSASHCMAAGTTTQRSRPVTTRKANGMESLFRLLESDNATVEQFNTAMMKLTGRGIDEVFDTIGRLKLKVTWLKVLGKKVTPISDKNLINARPFGRIKRITGEGPRRWGGLYIYPSGYPDVTPQKIEANVAKGVYERYKMRMEGSLAEAPAWIKTLVPTLAEYAAGRTFVYVPLQLRTWSDNVNVTYGTISMRKVRLSLFPDGRFIIETDTFLPFSIGGSSYETAFALVAEQVTEDCRRWNLIWYPVQATNYAFELIPNQKGVKK